MKTSIMLASALSAVMVAGLALAAPRDGGRHERGGPGPDRGMGPLGALLHNVEKAREMGVTDEQISALRQVLYDQHKARIQNEAAVDLARLEVRRLMEQDAPEEAAVMAALEKAAEAQLAARKAEVAGKLKVKSILGPELSAKLRAHAEAAWSRGGRHGGEYRRGDREGMRRRPAGPPADQDDDERKPDTDEIE